MSSQERASVIAIITGLLVNTYAIVRVSQLLGSGALAGDDAVTVWARAIVWIIPAAVGLTIVLNCLFWMATKDRTFNQVVDERDRKFRLRGMGITLIGVGLGFTTMLVGLAFGWSAVVGLSVLYFSVAAGDLVGNTVRLASYRIGA